MVATADVQRFKVAFNRLAVETRLPADQADAAVQRIYFEGLSDLPIEAIEEAARTLGRKAEWFPKLKEWRDAVRRVRREVISKLPPARLELPGFVEAQPQSPPVAELQAAMDDFLVMRAAGVTREDAVKGLEGLLRALMPMARAEPWHFDCNVCDDSGFELRTCYPDMREPCGMRSCRKQREHTYTVRCACWATNRTIQRRREAMNG